jgi:hypothetical protein
MIEPQPLPDEVKDFIFANAHSDIPSLVLKHSSLGGIPIAQVVDQIVGRRKASTKLPAYFAHELVLYPPALNLEQTSSETTAHFKTSLLASATTPGTIVDLTGGFGIDSLAFSEKFKDVVHVEPNRELQQLAQFDHVLLGARNIRYVNESAEMYLESMREVSAVYIDPSRRNASRKVYSFHDCSPDITAIQERIFKHTEVLLVKASPMHDIQLALAEIRYVQRVIVLAVDNEVRELLFLAVRDFTGKPVLSAVNIAHSDTVAMDFTGEEEREAVATFADIMTFIYEPNVALLKAGAFKLVSQRFHLDKLHINTHLYTSNELIVEFPGRIFRIDAVLKADHKSVLSHLPAAKANIIVRNYPSTPEALRKKLKLADGGDHYVLAFTSPAGPTLVSATRIR